MDNTFKTNNGYDVKASGLILYKTNLVTGKIDFLLQKKKNGIIEDFGGKIDKDLDKDWIDTAIREFEEETNNNETNIFDMNLIRNKVTYINKKNYFYILQSKYMLILVNYNNVQKLNLNNFSNKETHTGIIRDIIWVPFMELFTTLHGIYDPRSDFIKLHVRLQDNNFLKRIIEIKKQAQQKTKFIFKKWEIIKDPVPCFLFNHKKIIDYNNIKMTNYKGEIIFPFTNDNFKIFHKYILNNKDILIFINQKNIKKNEFNNLFETSLLINNYYHTCKIQRIKWEYKTFLLTVIPNLYANKYLKNNINKLNILTNNLNI